MMFKEDMKVYAYWAIVFAIMASIAVSQAYFEAKAFNKHTGKNVSTWDAMFLKLRLDGDE